jgi:hypothetical protein
MLDKICKLRFDAVDDTGATYRLELAEFSAPASTRGDPTGKARGQFLFTEDGQKVKQLGKGRFQIEGSGVVLTTNDPHALLIDL